MTLAGIPAHLYDDCAAWTANPRHRWVYSRLAVAETTGVPSGPLGVDPPEGMALVVKPVMNLFGMGRGARFVDIIRAALPLPYEPAMMWQQHLDGRHVSVDMRMNDGCAEWTATSIGYPGDRFGRFREWRIVPAFTTTIRAISWAKEHLPDYSGPLNVELIGGRIIEVHLRLTQDWLEAGIYGPHDTKPPPAATLIPIWSDDETEGDHGRIGYTVHRIGEAVEEICVEAVDRVI